MQCSDGRLVLRLRWRRHLHDGRVPGRLALCFAGANVFYDGFLPDISTAETIHRISARGIAYGYIGGGIHLVASFGMIAVLAEPVGSRIAIASAGVWFAVFAFIAFRHLRAAPGLSDSPVESFRVRMVDGLTKTRATMRQLRRHPDLAKLIVAYMLYGNGMQTVVALTAVYSADTLQLDQTTIIAAFLLVQVLSIPACYLATRLASRIGARTTLTLVLAGWVVAISLAFTLPAGAALPYYGLAVLIGLVLGPASALSRSLYASIIPQGSPAEFFGFYSLSSKFASILGPSSSSGFGKPPTPDEPRSSPSPASSLSAWWCFAGPISTAPGKYETSGRSHRPAELNGTRQLAR